MKRALSTFYVCLAAGCVVVSAAAGSAPAGPAAPQEASRLLAATPAWFEPNPGLFAPAVKYYARGAGYVLLIEPSGPVVSLRDGDAAGRVVISFEGGNPAPRLEALDPLPSRTDYYLGRNPANWSRRVPHFSRVRYRDAYPGIDVVYYGNCGQLEYDVHVSPGADPSGVRLRFRGADSVRLDGDGSLLIAVGGREIRQGRPLVYQEIAEGGSRRRVNIEGGYAVTNEGEVRFTLGAYDSTQPLVIDPVLSYSGYFGGGRYDVPTGMTTDLSGDIWITGTTYSVIEPPQVTGAYQAAKSDKTDVFVAKYGIQVSGEPLLMYWTYLGGSYIDEGGQIVADNSGRLLVTGTTYSEDFPCTDDALVSKYVGAGDAFLVKLDPTLDGEDSLIYGTFMGGTELDVPTAVSLSPAGALAITGYTASVNIAFVPEGDLTLQPHNQGGWDGFVFTFDASGEGAPALQFASYYGGGGSDVPVGVGWAPDGTLLLAGYTMSENLPVAGEGYNSFFREPCDLFVAKLDLNQYWLDILQFGAYFGGSDVDYATVARVDAVGAMWVSGYTVSRDFPVTASAYQLAYGGGASDAFLMRVDPAKPLSDAVTYATYVGGSDAEVFYDVLPLDASRVVVAGYSLSADFPVKNAPQGGGVKAAKADAVVMLVDSGKFGHEGALYSTFYGGSQDDVASVLLLDPFDRLYVMGYTGSADLPVTDGLAKPSPAGSVSGFLLRHEPLERASWETVNPLRRSAGENPSPRPAPLRRATVISPGVRNPSR